MTLYIAIGTLVAIGLVVLATRRYPRLYCALNGHLPRCSIEDCGVMKFTCDTCHREVDPRG